MASGGYWNTNAENTIRLWNIHTGQLLTTFKDHTAPVFALAFVPNVHGIYSGTLASAGWDNTIRMWHPRTGQLQAIFEGHTAPIFALAFPPDTDGPYGKTLASASLDGTIQLRIADRARLTGTVGCQRRWCRKHLGSHLCCLALRGKFTRPQRRRHRKHFGFDYRCKSYPAIGGKL